MKELTSQILSEKGAWNGQSVVFRRGASTKVPSAHASKAAGEVIDESIPSICVVHVVFACDWVRLSGMQEQSTSGE